MSIELRSLNSIRNAQQSIAAGDYSTESNLNFRLFNTYFTSTRTDQYEDTLVTMMESLDGHGGDLVKTLEICPTTNEQRHAGYCLLPARALTAALQKTPNLRTLKLVNVCLVGSNQDFEQIAVVLGKMSKLDYVYFSAGARLLTTTTNNENDNLDVFAMDKALASIGGLPSLKSIQLHFGKSIHKLSLSTLESLCQHPKSVFEMATYDFNDQETVAVSNAFNANPHPTLKKFLFYTKDLGMDGSQALAKLLATPRPKLRDIHICVKTVCDAVDNPSAILQTLADALGQSLATEMRVGVPSGLLSEAHRIFRDMMRGNYRVTRFRLDYIWDEVEDEEIEFLVKTNKLGRQSLFQQEQDSTTTKCTWMTLFGAAEGKLDNIYYLVRSHPNEFATMGLQDCSLNMVPTTRVLKTLLHSHGQERDVTLQATVKRMGSKLAEAVAASTVETSFRVDGKLEGQNRTLTGHMDGNAAAIGEKLMVAKQAVKDSLSSKLQSQTKEIRGILVDHSKALRCDMEGTMDSKLEAFSQRVQGNFEAKLTTSLMGQSYEMGAAMGSTLKSSMTDLGETFETKLQSALKTELETSLTKQTSELEAAMGIAFKAAADEEKTALVELVEEKFKAKLVQEGKAIESKIQLEFNGLTMELVRIKTSLNVLVFVLVLLIAGVAALLCFHANQIGSSSVSTGFGAP